MARLTVSAEATGRVDALHADIDAQKDLPVVTTDVIATPGRGQPAGVCQHADTDPVRLVRAWRALLAEHEHRTGPVLGDPTRPERGEPAHGRMNDLVQAAAARAELANAAGYSAHSLRAAGATAAYRAGAPVSTIAAHGQWSPCSLVVLSYARSVDRWRDNALAGFGLDEPGPRWRDSPYRAVTGELCGPLT